jgi:prepilin-type N-terminal cleavage/methylation domain-containing protein
MARKRSTGFTLVELVAAIVLLAVAVPPMLWATRQSQHQYVDPVLSSRARWLATEKLEDIIADRYSSTRGFGYLISSNYPDELVGTISGYAGYARQVTLAQTTADLITPGTGYMTVTVRVSWTGAEGKPRETSVSTVLTEFTP